MGLRVADGRLLVAVTTSSIKLLRSTPRQEMQPQSEAWQLGCSIGLSRPWCQWLDRSSHSRNSAGQGERITGSYGTPSQSHGIFLGFDLVAAACMTRMPFSEANTKQCRRIFSPYGSCLLHKVL